MLNTLLLLIACSLGMSVAHAAPTQEFLLKNGMKVIVKEDHRAPTVAHMVWYKVGAIDEKNGTTGVAHALEHMMFKGTKTLKPGEFSAKVAALGGRENAFTGHDYTAYFEQIDQSRLEAVMALEADRMRNLVFDAKEFAKEIRVVQEERRWRTDDQPQALVHEALHAAAFMAHPYHHPVVGWMDDLQNMTVADAKAWYDAWYAPNNATLVVVGDVDAQKVHRLAEQYFGKIPAKTLLQTKPQQEPRQQGVRRVTVEAPAENPYLAMAYKVPTLRDVEKDDDVFALEVLQGILDGYDNARLGAQLVRAEHVANEVGADYSGIARGPGLFVLDGVPAQGTTVSQLEEALRQALQKIAQEGVTSAELERVKRQLVAAQVYKRDSIFGQAMEIGRMEMSGSKAVGHQHIDRLVERVKQVTKEQVQAVAQRYFRDDQLTIATLVPLPVSAKAEKKAAPPAGLRH